MAAGPHVSIPPAICALALLLAGILLTFPYWSLIAYTHPQVDDYSYGRLVFRRGFWFFQWVEYKIWGGRYTQHLLLALGFSSIGGAVNYYALLIASVHASVVAAMAYLLWVLSRHSGLRDKERAAFCCGAALLFWGVSLIVSPDPAGSFYIFNALTCYQFTLALFLLELSLLLRFLDRKSPSIPLLCCLCACAFFLSGGVESFTGAHVFFLTSLVALSWKSANNSTRRYLILFTVIALAGALIEVLAPGNGIRARHFPRHGNVLLAFQTGMGGPFQVLSLLLSSLPALFLMLFMGWGIAKLRAGDARRCLKAGVIFLLMVAAMCFVSGYAVGNIGPDRQKTLMLQLALISGSCLSAAAIGRLGGEKYPAAGLLLGVAFLLAAALTPRYQLAWKDLQLAPKYKLEQMTRHEILLRSATGKPSKRHAYIPMLKTRPYHLFSRDIKPR